MAHCGLYRGSVVNTADPTMKGRVQVAVPSVAAAPTSWAMPCRPYGSTKVPPVGSLVWVMFEGGNLSYPVWMGCMS